VSRDPLARLFTSSDTPDDLTLRVGTVSSTSPLEVMIAGTSGLTASRIASYTPTLNDQVAVLQNKTDYLVLGKIITGG
jgi:hypothetical protein